MERKSIPKIVGGLAALAALASGLLAQVDPVVCVQRAALAFMLGWVCGQVWQLLLSLSSRNPSREITGAEGNKTLE